jgi:hypothetical protein
MVPAPGSISNVGLHALNEPNLSNDLELKSERGTIPTVSSGSNSGNDGRRVFVNALE